MRTHQDPLLDPEPDVVASARTTAAGLDAWLGGADAHAVPPDPASRRTAEAGPPAPFEPVAIGPVNAAEALALARVLPTFSSPRKLGGADGAELVVDPGHDAYYFESTSLKPLAALLQQPASAWTPISAEAAEAARAAEQSQPLERLRWYAGLIATPGILGRNLDRGDHYKLAHWPETEREFPRHFRIARAMLEDAATIEQIAAAAGAEYDDVVDYINASFASGRLAAAPATVATANPAPSRRARLMAVLNKPLFVR